MYCSKHHKQVPQKALISGRIVLLEFEKDRDLTLTIHEFSLFNNAKDVQKGEWSWGDTKEFVVVDWDNPDLVDDEFRITRLSKDELNFSYTDENGIDEDWELEKQ